MVRSYLMDGGESQTSPPSASRTSSTAAITEDRFVGVDDLPSPGISPPLERQVREVLNQYGAASERQVQFTHDVQAGAQ